MTKSGPDKSHQVNIEADQEHDKPRTDWLAWSLQLIFGFVVGFGAMFRIARIIYRSGFLGFDQMFLAMLGGGFCCGAFASYYGDRAWMSPSIFEPRRPLMTEQARKWSMLTGGFGGLLILVPIGLHLGASGWPSGGLFTGEFDSFRLLLAAIPGLLLFYALRTGTVFWMFRKLEHNESPLCFWIYVSVMALGTFCLLFGR